MGEAAWAKGERQESVVEGTGDREEATALGAEDLATGQLQRGSDVEGFSLYPVSGEGTIKVSEHALAC